MCTYTCIAIPQRLFIYKCSWPYPISADGVTVNTGKVIEADIKASNGVIHKIDHVLIPVRVAFWLGTGIGKK